MSRGESFHSIGYIVCGDCRHKVYTKNTKILFFFDPFPCTLSIKSYIKCHKPQQYCVLFKHLLKYSDRLQNLFLKTF